MAVDIYNARGAHTYEAEGVGGWISLWEANKGGPRPPRNPSPKMSKIARGYEASYEIAPGEQRTLLYFPGAAPGPTTHRDRCHRC